MATSDDHQYTNEITDAMAYSAAMRGTNVAPRTADFVIKKMDAGLAVIAINPENGKWAGFCYLEVWKHEKLVANSGLIVSPEYRGMGVSTAIKIELFQLCRERFPNAKILSLTTSPAVIHVNIELGYKIVPHSDILNDTLFLKGCNSWVNFTDLMNKEHANLHYMAMIFDPVSNAKKQPFQQTNPCFINKKKLAWEKKDTGIALDRVVA